MFSAMLFAPGRMGSREVEQVALESEQVCIYKTMHAFPPPYELTRLLNTFQPDIVLVELQPLEEALRLVREVRVIRPEAVVIGYGLPWPDPEREQVSEAGVEDVMESPPTPESLRAAVARAVRGRPALQDNLLAFLPAKAGSGATTVAINTAAHLALGFDQRVILMDTDLHSGLVSLLLRVEADYSILDALDSADRLDGTLWSRIVARAHGMDLLVTAQRRRAPLVCWDKYHQLLRFVSGRYDSVVVDLPEVVNDATVEIVRRARRVFVVATPELPPLVLARQRCQELKARGVSADRLGVIVNRWNKDEIQISDIERLVEEPVAAVFHNDYRSMRKAVNEGRPIGPKTEVGRSFAAFAQKLLGGLATPPQPPRQPLEVLTSR